MNLHFLFPVSPLNGRMIDEAFQDQAIALKMAGFETSVLTDDMKIIGPLSKVDGDPDVRVIYRGWMMKVGEYENYLNKLSARPVTPLTSMEQYLATHWLPNWYPILSNWTPNTVVVPNGADVVATVRDLGWEKFQLKDWVKSLKTAGGSVATSPEKVPEILANMEKYRGTIEGGICVRQWENFVPGTETRYFVVNGRFFGRDIAFDTRVMRLLDAVKNRIASPFWSVDIAYRADGEFRIVEIGDGQVSDLVGWSPQRFAEVWK